MTAVDVEKMNWKYYQEILEVNTRKITDVRKNLEFHDYQTELEGVLVLLCI